MNWLEDLQLLNWRRRRRRGERQREIEIRQNRLRLRLMRDSADPFALSDDIFQGQYHLSKDLVRALIEEVRPNMAVSRRSTRVPVETKVLCALHFYVQGSCQKTVGKDSNLGLSQSSVSNTIQEVTSALNSLDCLRKWVDFPLTRSAVRNMVLKNSRTSPLPGVLGYLDSMHVAIKAPRECEHMFMNRKSYHSLNCQIVCDADLLILNVLARFPGSVTNSYIWAKSAVRERMVEMWVADEKCWLLGDLEYPHEPWLQTPIMNAPRGSREALYMGYHKRAHSAVERCIGQLRARFQCLLQHRVLEYEPEKAGGIINACCVLHNMCVKARLPPPLGMEDIGLPVHQEEVEAVVPPASSSHTCLQQAQQIRRHYLLPSLIESSHPSPTS